MTLPAIHRCTGCRTAYGCSGCPAHAEYVTGRCPKCSGKHTGPDARGPREIAFDREIAPKLAAIHDVCRRYGIPYVAAFDFDRAPGRPTHYVGVLVPADAGASRVADASDLLLSDKRSPPRRKPR